MKFNIQNIENILVFLCFFCMGFYQFTYCIAIFFLLLIMFYIQRKLTLNTEYLRFFFLIFSGLIFLYLFSYFNGIYDNFENKGEVLAVFIFSIISFIVIAFGKNSTYIYSLVGCVFGLGIYSLYSLWYTKNELGFPTAYANVWNPFMEVYQNSPPHAINMALMVSVILILITNVKNLFVKSLFILFLLFSVYYGLYSGSRIFIIISILSLIFLILKKNELKYYISLGGIIILFSFYFMNLLDSEELTAFSRLTSEGLESRRFDLYGLGINNLFYYPFGGYQIDKSTYGTVWNHNFFLDVSRMAGFIPLLYFIAAIFYLMKKIYNNFGALNKDVLIILSCSLILMMQDVIFTGHFMLFIVFLICSLIIVQKPAIR